VGDWIFYMFDHTNKHRYSCKKSYTVPKSDDVVVGDSVKKGYYQGCSFFRIGKSEPNNCGYNGYYWEPKHKQDLFKFIKKVADEH
jgi:hypothetical protein